MSLYISEQQSIYSEPKTYETLPVLFDHRKGIIRHRIYSPYYKYAHIVLDTYEVSNRNLTEISYPITPTGSVSLLFFLGNGARGEILGCNTSLIYVPIPSNTYIYCVRLRPGALRCFGENDVSTLTDRMQKMESLMKHSYTLCQQLRYAESFHERNVMMQRFLDIYHAEKFREMEKVAKCLQIIAEKHGIIRIQELAQKIACSSRYINRLFISHIGIAPKLYCQIIQLDTSLHEVLLNRPKSLLDTAVRWGYFDQAHMNRIYQKFLKKTAYEMKNFTYNDISQKELLLDMDIGNTFSKHKLFQ